MACSEKDETHNLTSWWRRSMFKFVTALIVSASVALAAIPQQAHAGGRGLALGVGIGLGAAVLMHQAHKSQQAAQRREIARQRAIAQREAAARKAAAQKAAIAAKEKQARIAAAKREAVLEAELQRQKELTLAAMIKLPERKPDKAPQKVAKANLETDDAEESQVQTASYDNDGGSGLDCKRYIPSAGLTISVPCGQ
jgi:hypothetical protein